MLRGTITIRSHVGRHGPFKVGVLNVGFAQYIVKDPAIEEIDVGSHAGQFEIATTFLKSYPYPGRLIIENRAIVSHIALDDETQTVAQAAAAQEAERVAVADVDPVDEDARPPANVVVAAGAAPEPATESVPAPIESSAPVQRECASIPTDEELARIQDQSFATLFGPLWPFGAEVKLDKTIDRLRLRQQIKSMDSLGYEFQKQGQVWIKKAA